MSSDTKVPKKLTKEELDRRRNKMRPAARKKLGTYSESSQRRWLTNPFMEAIIQSIHQEELRSQKRKTNILWKLL
jgi:hypothetical protein